MLDRCHLTDAKSLSSFRINCSYPSSHHSPACCLACDETGIAAGPISRKQIACANSQVLLLDGARQYEALVLAHALLHAELDNISLTGPGSDCHCLLFLWPASSRRSLQAPSGRRHAPNPHTLAIDYQCSHFQPPTIFYRIVRDQRSSLQSLSLVSFASTRYYCASV